MIALLALSALLQQESAIAGPGRFCSYSAVIDLLPGETVEPLDGGMHGGTFRWSGKFGTLLVQNTGWGKRPEGTMTSSVTATGQTVFKPRKGKKTSLGLWNRQYGVATFSSDASLSPDQRAAIDRVYLVNEGEDAAGCKFRTIVELG